MKSTRSEADVVAFANLFASGLKDARGGLWGVCIKEPLRLDHYRRHLDGVESLGIYPLRRDDGCCRYAAVDIDLGDDPEPAVHVVHELSDLGLHPGVYLELSRRKGWHVHVFFSDWVLARDVRRILLAAVKAAGLDPTTEVFPKQTSLAPEEFGNYLNLPYFGRGDPHGRRMIHDIATVRPIPFDHWLPNAEPFPAEYLSLVLGNIPPEAVAKAPNSHTRRKSAGELDALFNNTLTEGFRRAGAGLPAAVEVLRGRGIPEGSAVALLLPWARQHCDPPLPDGEVEKHVRSMYKRYGVPDTKSRGRFRLPPWGHAEPVRPLDQQVRRTW